MQALAVGQRFSKWFWIAVLAVIGFGLLSNFGPMALLVCGFIVLMAKIFISAARNNKGISEVVRCQFARLAICGQYKLIVELS